jgi:heptosyltransferase-3
MRTLVLQLGPSADLYLSWPTLKALARATENSVFALVRAHHGTPLAKIEGLKVFEFDCERILQPISDSGDVVTATKELCLLLESLAAYDFDEIINLSFSPLSSFLTDFLTASHTSVKGYTRHADGHLAIPDDASAYYYAQVGVGRPNRYPMQEILAAVAQVDLIETDFVLTSSVAKTNSIAVCIQSLKPFGATLTEDLIRQLSVQVDSTTQVVAVDGNDLEEIAAANVLIAGVGASMHIASLSQTPVLALCSSLSSAFAEGPTCLGSQVIVFGNDSELSAKAIATLAVQQTLGLPLAIARLEKSEPRAPLNVKDAVVSDWSWRLLQALYAGANYPPLEGTGAGFQRLFEMAELAEQMLSGGQISQKVTEMLGMMDRMLEEVAKMDSQVAPVVAWFNTERLRLPPAALEDTWEATHKIFADLKLVASVYIPSEDPVEVAGKVRNLSLKCSAALREYDFAAVEKEFFELLSALQLMARGSTKVGDCKWSQVLAQLQHSLEARDFIDLADQLEHELMPRIDQLEGATKTMGVIL